MNVQEIIVEVSRLPLKEQMVVSEAISSNLHKGSAATGDKVQATEKLLALLQPVQSVAAEWDWKQAKEDYLTEKYLKS